MQAHIIQINVVFLSNMNKIFSLKYKQMINNGPATIINNFKFLSLSTK